MSQDMGVQHHDIQIIFMSKWNALLKFKFSSYQDRERLDSSHESGNGKDIDLKGSKSTVNDSTSSSMHDIHTSDR